MHGGAYGRVRGGGGGAGNAPRLVIGFALVMAVAAFLSWSSSPAPQQPTAKRVVSNGGLVRGTIGQAEDMGNLLGAASADVVANAKAAALQDPSANAGAGKGINEGAADITDGIAMFDSSSAYGAGPLPDEPAFPSAAAARIRGSRASGGAASGSLAGIADAVAAGQAGGFNKAGSASSGQQSAAQAKQSGGTAPLQGGSGGTAAGSGSAAEEQATENATKGNMTAGSLSASVADDSKLAGSANSKARAGSARAGSSNSQASASRVDEVADTDYAEAADSLADGAGADSVFSVAADSNGSAGKAVGTAAGAQGVASSRSSAAGAGSSAGKAAEHAAGGKVSPENELVLGTADVASAGGAAKLADSSGQVDSNRQLPESSSAAVE